MSANPEAGCMLSVVIPAFNEESCLEQVVEETLAVLKVLAVSFEIIVVDDGSTDATAEIAARLVKGRPHVRLVQHHRQSGSGQAIATGIAAACGTWVIYVPADGQFHVPEIGRFLAATCRGDIVIGARLERSDYSAFRRLSSAVFTALVTHLFSQQYRDVNWVHLWRREIFACVRIRSQGVFFLEETLVRARRAGYEVTEIDSVYKPRAGGVAKGAKLSTILTTVNDMARLYLELQVNTEETRMLAGRRDKILRAARLLGRYSIAAAMIPVGVAIGSAGVATYWTRKRRSLRQSDTEG